MTGPIVVTADQLARRQPGGIGTYVLGLLAGLGALAQGGECDCEVVVLAPRGTPLAAATSFGATAALTPFGERVTTRRWRHGATGVPASAGVVHATATAGPFRGGAPGARHSVLVHDLLWRDHPELTTRRGARFHEARLRQVLESATVRILVTSAVLREALLSLGAPAERVHTVRLGVTPIATTDGDPLSSLGITEPFTLSVGTIEPRKNLARLVAAHRRARAVEPGLGTLVLAGAAGWGRVDTADAVTTGRLDAATLGALWRRCRVAASVPIAEGWGFPAAEALAAGRPLVASTTVPSVADNPCAIRVAPTDVEEIADGLLRAVREPDGEVDRAARAASVAQDTWENCARDHLRAWA